MALVPQFTSASLKRLFRSRLDKMEDEIIRAFELVGMEAVNESVRSGSYIDRTGNLRNSAAYVIGIDGVVVSEFHKNDFGRDFALKILAEEGSQGIVLIVVSGMSYAIYVESKNYIVLTSAEKLAEKRLPKILKQLANANNN